MKIIIIFIIVILHGCLLDTQLKFLMPPDGINDINTEERIIPFDSIDTNYTEQLNEHLTSCGNGICEIETGEDCLSCPLDCYYCFCGTSQDCPEGYQCLHGLCKIICSTNAQCDYGWFCIDGICAGYIDIVCSNHKDDDMDGLVDCNDPDCQLNGCIEVCQVERGQNNCTDGIDNDGDTFIDCDDTGCIFDLNVTACSAGSYLLETGNLCTNGIDDDGDGKKDCADPECIRDPHVSSCNAEKTNHNCEDNIDNDGNGLTDCNDPVCTTTISVTNCCMTING